MRILKTREIQGNVNVMIFPVPNLSNMLVLTSIGTGVKSGFRIGVTMLSSDRKVTLQLVSSYCALSQLITLAVSQDTIPLFELWMATFSLL